MMGRREERLPREVMADIEAAGIRRGVPLLAVDADEVLVEFAAHLARWLDAMGYEMRLTEYRLEGAIFGAGEADPVSFEGAIRLIDAFFEEETRAQQALAGAVEAVSRLGREAQVVVLTNVPRPARAARVTNLAGLGIEAPVVANAGGKGRALRLMAEKADAPVVFVDDSPGQIESAAKHSDHVARIHFRGSPYIRPVLPPSALAHDDVGDWT
ncbi:MAG: hypothetical protein AAFV86_22265, partial [Pseudomonadota bacterium]